jgi:hypothetical protein
MRVPELQKEPAPKEPIAGGVGGDEMFDDNIGAGDIFGGNGRTDELLAAEAGASAVEEPLKFKPPSPGPQIEPKVRCPVCGALNRQDTEFCVSCGETIISRAESPGFSTVAKIPLSLAASFGFTLAGAVAWTLLAYLFGLRWLHFLAILVAALAGYGLTLFTEKRSAAFGLLAALIGFVGIISGKVFIAKWVVLPNLENPFASAEWKKVTPTDREVDERMKDPNEMFRAACFQMAEDGEFDEKFARKVVDTHYDGRAPLGEAEQVKAGIERVEKALNSWSDTEKREAIRAQYARDIEAFKDFGKALIAAGTKSAEETKDVPETVRETAREANELISGDRTLAETKIGFFFAFLGSFSFLDLLFFPMGLWSAYKIGSGRQ